MEGYGQIAGHQFRVNRDLCNHDPRGCDPAMIVQAKRVSDAFGRFRRVASCRDAVDRVATVAASASDGQDSLYASDYGVFAIAICGYRCLGSTGVYHPPPRFVGRACTDLASGRHFKRLPPTLALVPLESLVLVIT